MYTSKALTLTFHPHILHQYTFNLPILDQDYKQHQEKTKKGSFISRDLEVLNGIKEKLIKYKVQIQSTLMGYHQMGMVHLCRPNPDQRIKHSHNKSLEMKLMKMEMRMVNSLQRKIQMYSKDQLVERHLKLEKRGELRRKLKRRKQISLIKHIKNQY